MTHVEYRQWCEYESWELKRTTKLDFYLARLTAYMAAQCKPKAQFTVDQFLLGKDDDVPPGHKDLRKMSSDEVKSLFRAALPYATYTEATNG